MFNSWGLVNAYGTWSSYYVGHSLRGVDQLELNLVGSTQSALVLLFSNVVGRLLDAGNFRKVIACGTFLVPFGLFMLSVAHPSDIEAMANFGTIWLTQGFVVGLGMATFFVSSSQGKKGHRIIVAFSLIWLQLLPHGFLSAEALPWAMLPAVPAWPV